ncbi:MAG: YfhO family protein [Saccharofermentanales bacterium]
MPSIFIFFILTVVYVINKLYPFGSNTLAWCDMKQQVIPLMLQWKEILSGNQSILFQMNNAGGSNFWGIFFFFLSSPFSFLIRFIDKSDSVIMMNIIVAVKIALSSVCAMIMFSRIFPKIRTVFCICLSVAYALCGFSLMFFQNLVWLDLVYMFPLLIIGMYNLIYNHKIALFCVSLTLIFIINYYMSYMVILFLIFAFGIIAYSPVKNIMNHNKNDDKNDTRNDNRNDYRKVIGLFIFSSLLSAVLASFVWIPSFFQYLKSARIISFISNLSSGYFFTYYYTTASVLMTTSLLLTIFIFFYIYLFKIVSPLKMLFMFTLLVLPVFIEPINKMWHAGSYQAFPARYGYITTIAGLLILAYYYSHTPFMIKGYIHDKSEENKTRWIFAVISAIITLAACAYSIFILITKKNEIDEYIVTLWNDETSFLLLLRIFIIFGLAHITILLFGYFRKLNANLFITCFCILLLFESFFSTNVFIGYSANDPEYYKPIFDLEDKISDDEIYRVKTNEKYFDVSLLGGLGYNTLNTYTSLTSEKYLYVMKKLGFSSYWMEIDSTQGSIFSDALMSNKYEIVKNYYPSYDKEVIYQNDIYKIQKNPLFMKLATMISIPDISRFENMPEGNRFTIQNRLFDIIFNSEKKLFVEYPVQELTNIKIQDDGSMKIIDYSQEAKIHYSIDIKGKKALYFDCFDKVTNNLEEVINDSFQVIADGVEIQRRYPNKEVNGLLDLGEYEDETVNIDLILLKDVKAESLGVASLDKALLSATINGFNNVSASTNIEQHKNRFTIKTIAKDMKDPYLFISIPYDEGFKAEINGKPADIVRLFSGFMGVKLVPGLNNIELAFFPQGLLIGIIISFIGGILGIILFAKRKYLTKTKIFQHILSLVYNSYFVIFIIIFAMVYIVPIIIYMISNYL